MVIIALQMAVVRWTARRSAPSLLIVVGGIWVLSWLILAAASHVPGLAATLFVTTFGIFAVGETMYAPVLNPLTASLAPSGMVGTTLGVFGAIQTSGSAVGPLLAGVALNAGHGTVFVAAARGHQPRGGRGRLAAALAADRYAGRSTRGGPRRRRARRSRGAAWLTRRRSRPDRCQPARRPPWRPGQRPSRW